MRKFVHGDDYDVLLISTGASCLISTKYLITIVIKTAKGNMENIAICQPKICDMLPPTINPTLTQKQTLMPKFFDQ